MKKILVIGSLNMDIVTKVHKTPKVGETVSGDGILVSAGGKGANQAVAMGKLGSNVAMIGKVGNDENGKALKNNLLEFNVIDKVEIVDSPTGTAFIMVNDDGDNSIVVVAGANDKILPSDVLDEWFEGVDFVVLQNEIREDTVYKILEVANKLGKSILYNPAPAKKIDSRYISLVDYLVVNETEFEVITGFEYIDDTSLVEARKKLKVKNILLTLGKRGSILYDGENMIFVEAMKVKAVDTTAAGDSFIGGFLCYLSQGKSIKESLEFATKVAGYTVTNFGAQSSLPYLKDLKGL